MTEQTLWEMRCLQAERERDEARAALQQAEWRDILDHATCWAEVRAENARLRALLRAHGIDPEAR